MKTLRKLRQNYDIDKRIRHSVLAIALVLSFANYYSVLITLVCIAEPETVPLLLWPLGVIAFPLCLAVTISLYYIADGFAVFPGLVFVITKAVTQVAGVFIPLLGVLAGIGYLISLLIALCAIPATIIACVYFAYTLPIIGVPLLHYFSKKLNVRTVNNEC